MEDADKLWALNGQFDIPSAHVIGAESAEAEARQWLHVLRLGGIHVPGVLSAGRFCEHGHLVFRDVHGMAPRHMRRHWPLGR